MLTSLARAFYYLFIHLLLLLLLFFVVCWYSMSISEGVFLYHTDFRYYYNKKTRQSSWEKPLELMTPIEVGHYIKQLQSIIQYDCSTSHACYYSNEWIWNL